MIRAPLIALLVCPLVACDGEVVLPVGSGTVSGVGGTGGAGGHAGGGGAGGACSGLPDPYTGACGTCGECPGPLACDPSSNLCRMPCDDSGICPDSDSPCWSLKCDEGLCRPFVSAGEPCDAGICSDAGECQ